jgi:type I restriction enzyme S subunit
MEECELPVGWASAILSDLIAPDGEFSDGDWVESKDQDPNGNIRLLQLADIGDAKFLDKSARFVNEVKFAELRCTEVLENDVLIARLPGAAIAAEGNYRC